MDLNSDLSFSKNVIEVCDHQIKLLKDEHIFLLQNTPLDSHYGKWIQSQWSKSMEDENASLEEIKKQIGVVCVLKKGEKKNIQVNYSSSHFKSTLIKNFIFLEEFSSLSWFENICSSQFQIETYIHVANQATLQKLVFNLQDSSLRTLCDLHHKSCLLSFDFNLNSSTQYTKVRGQDSEHLAILQGLNVLHEKQQVRQRIETQHEGEKGYGRQRFYSVLGGKSRSHVHSKVIINAQGTDSHQLLKNLILNPYAQAKNQPELEVSKDQVKASHGSTTGQPNPLEIFYMNTRGVSSKKALEFLVHGWVESVFNLDEDEDIISDSFENFVQQVQPIYPFIKKHINRML